MFPNRNELRVLVKSVVSFVILFISVLVFLRIAVAGQHFDTWNRLHFGGTINSSKLDDYNQAKEIIFYCSIGIALIMSQSAMWFNGKSNRCGNDKAEQEDSNRPR